MKVAFATGDLATVDAHFGWAAHVVVHDVDEPWLRKVLGRPLAGPGPEGGAR